MRKIVLACMAGLSTSILVSKMREAAAAMGYECGGNAYPISNVGKEGADADIVLFGPQVRLQLDSVKGAVQCPVEVIDMMAYGMMDGKKVMDQVRNTLGD